MSEELNSAIAKLSITPEQHAEVVKSPEALTKMLLDVVAVATYIAHKETDKWIVERTRDIVPMQFAGLIISLTHPELANKELEFLQAMTDVKKEQPQISFVELVDRTMKRMKETADE